jgi:uncharacterized protein (TIGR02145 family)
MAGRKRARGESRTVSLVAASKDTSTLSWISWRSLTVALPLSLYLASGVVATLWTKALAKDQEEPRTGPSRRMADGKQWTVENLNVDTKPSYCYEDAEQNCSRYGRLYTWESARRACPSLGDGWRLPTDDDWRQLTTRYGGVSQDSSDKGKAAFTALLTGGSSGFDAVLGGGRSPAGEYGRLEAHGFYWTASESDPATAWFYNFGKGGLAVHRQRDGEKQGAFSVRCVRE